MTVGATITMVRKGDRLELTSPVFLEELLAIPEGREVTVELSLDRNPDQLKWYWAMLGACIRAGYWDGDKDGLDDRIRLGIGWGKWRAKDDGTSIFIPKSIALTRCDGLRFKRFLFYVERFLAERMGVDTETIFAEANRETGHSVDRRAA